MAIAQHLPSFDIPATYKAVVYDNPGTISTSVVEKDTPEPGPGEVLIHLTHSGVCHSDMGVMEQTWRALPYPTPPGQVGGHEGVGVVEKLGPGAELSNVKLGDRVGIKWVAYACASCQACLEGQDGVCFNQKISGYYHPGTFQQYAIGPASYVTPIPDGLESAEAAPLLCAGVTIYSALRKSNAESGQWVAIVGAGGGLGHLGVQMGSRAMAYRVLAIDHGSKEKLAMDCGAEAFIDITKFSRDEDLAEEAKRLSGGLGVSAVIVCTASNRAYAQALDFLRFNGTLVCLGMPEGESVPIAKAFPAFLVAKGQKIVGSSVGTQKQALEVMDLARRGLIKVHYRLEKMSNLTEVFQQMKRQNLVGRVVLDLQ